MYHVTVTSRDSAVHGALSSSVNVTINVLDVDDCPPTFERPLYRAHVSVDCPVGHEVTPLTIHCAVSKRIDDFRTVCAQLHSRCSLTKILLCIENTSNLKIPYFPASIHRVSKSSNLWLAMLAVSQRSVPL